MEDPARIASFDSTAWTIVLNAGLSNTAARTAFGTLYQTYSYPLYAYLRSKKKSPAEAEELVQAFFVWLLEKEVVAKADPQRGRFRNFLLKSLNNFLLDRWKYQNAAKRQAVRPSISLDVTDAESKFLAHPSHGVTAERILDRAWAVSVLEEAMRRLCSECRFREDGPCAICLHGCLTGDFDINTQRASEQLKLSRGAVRVALHRLRQRFGEILREEVAQTVDDPSQIDDEIRHLTALVAAK